MSLYNTDSADDEVDTDPGIGPNTLSVNFDEEKTPVAAKVPAKVRRSTCYVCGAPNPDMTSASTDRLERSRAINCREGCYYPEVE